MPDLQTELSKVLNTWNQPENVMQPETKSKHPKGDGSVGRSVFNLIKATPGLTIEEYEEMGRAQGIQINSTRNYILLFCKTNWRLAANTDGAITLLSPEYRTRVEMLGFKRGARGSKVERARNKAIRELRAARKQAAEAVAEVAPAEPPKSKSWLRDALIAHVSANQGCSRMDVIRALTAQGMNEGSVVATLNTAVRKGHLVSVHGLVWTPQARQEERNNHSHLAQIEQLVKELEQQYAKEQEDARKAVAALAVEKQNEVDVENMTVREARVLFDKLRHLFGPQA